MTDQQEQLKKDMAFFEAEIKATAKKLPDYNRKELTFTPAERQLLAQQATIEVLVRQAQEIIINTICLPRSGIIPSNKIHVRYSVGLGRFVIFSPKEK